MFHNLKGHPQRAHLIHLNSKVTTAVAATLVTHFVAFAVQMYQMHSLKMTLQGVKHVGVTYSINRMVHNSI